MTAGLRERKKRETRQAISDVATMLFLERGFDHVTIAEVAEAAGVSKMTVTNYFPRKEDLLFDRADAIITSLARAVAERAPGESMLAAIRRSYTESVRRADVTLGLSSPQFAGLVLGSPVLVSRGLEIMDERERALAGAMAAELGTDTVQQRLVAALLASVHRVVAAEGWRRSLAGEPRPQILAALAAEATAGFDRLEPALGNYGIRPAAPGADPAATGGSSA